MRRFTAASLILVLLITISFGTVHGAGRVVAEMTVLSEHSARVTLSWSDGADLPVMISGWRFNENGLMVYYETGDTVREGLESRTIKNDSLTFPMKLTLEANGQDSHEFTDYNLQNPGYNSVMNLYARGIISGYPDGSFRGGNPVTRTEFAKMLMTTAAYETQSDRMSTFTDVSNDFWGKDYIMTLAEKGIINGKGEGIFDPQGSIKMGEVLAVVTRTFTTYGKGDTYAYGLTGHWSDTAFLRAVDMALVLPTDSFYVKYDPEALASREQCAIILSRVLEQLHERVD